MSALVHGVQRHRQASPLPVVGALDPRSVDPMADGEFLDHRPGESAAVDVLLACRERAVPARVVLVETLVSHAVQAPADGDAWTALRDFLFAATDAVIADVSLSPVFAAPVNALPHTTELKQRLTALFGRLLDQAHPAGAADPGVTQADMVPLMCGVVYAANVHPAATAEDRAANARRYLVVLLEGLRTRA
ncbi:hypothetical protein [Streptomyces sp. MAA16]|uniref:SbtR family transcriptional regulator n=1 Tax=Streptomyces sp. MAA16 TaxID=3035116 RepID=UPI002476FE0D|nr:hypothetical protein [Streptomyces sp. MAA16]MDH6695570.1 hypothetical protein [Streptomyces sp. MAA16]